MTLPKQALVLGIGSDHGDDCIGWRVIDHLCRQGIDQNTLHKLSTPLQLLEHLGHAKTIHIVDAANGLAEDESVRRLDHIDSLRHEETLGTHGIGICQALQLAQSLGKSVDRVVIWLANGQSFAPMAQPSSLAKESAQRCATAIEVELTNVPDGPNAT